MGEPQQQIVFGGHRVFIVAEKPPSLIIIPSLAPGVAKSAAREKLDRVGLGSAIESCVLQ